MLVFLLARIADDEEAAARILRRNRRTPLATGDPSSDPHGAARSTARAVQQECRAKRRAIGDAQQTLLLRVHGNDPVISSAALATLRSMVGPYSDHVSCRAEWLVE